MARRSETLLMKFLVESRDAIRSFRSVDGALERLSRNARDAADSMDDIGDEAEQAAAETASAFRKLGIRSDIDAAQQERRWVEAFETIRGSGVASSEDIARAEEEMNFRIGNLRRRQHRLFIRRQEQVQAALRDTRRIAFTTAAAIARIGVGGIRATSVGLSRLSSISARVASGITRSASTIVKGLTRISTGSAKLFAGVTVAGGAAAGTFAKQVGDVAGEFERITIALKATTGSDYEQARKFVEDYAKEVVFSQEQISESLLSLRNFGFSQSDAESALPALIDQVAKLGGTYADLEGISLAVGQAWAKQKLQGEEILQLVERGVPVWELLEKVTGENVATLQDMSSAGELGQDVIRDLIAEIGKGAAGSATAQLDSYNGILAQLSKGWKSLLNDIGEGGVLEALKDQIKGLIDFMGRPDVVRIATRFAEIGVKAIGLLVRAVQDLILGFGDRGLNVIDRWLTNMESYFKGFFYYADKVFNPAVRFIEEGTRSFINGVFALIDVSSKLFPVFTRIMSGVANAFIELDYKTVDRFISGLVTVGTNLVNGVIGFFSKIKPETFQFAVDVIVGLFETLSESFNDVANGESAQEWADKLSDGILKVTNFVKTLTSELKILFAEGFGSENFETGFFKGLKSFVDNELPKIKEVLDIVNNLVNNPGETLGKGAGGAVKGLGSFLEGFFKSLASGLLGGVGIDTGYYNGGYTGDGGKYQAAGTVHKGEYVFNQESVRRWGVPALESLAAGAIPAAIAAPSVAMSSSRSAGRMTLDLNVPGAGKVSVEGDANELRKLKRAIHHSKAKITASKPRGSI